MPTKERKADFRTLADFLCAGLLSLGAVLVVLSALGHGGLWLPPLIAVVLSLFLFLLWKKWPLPVMGAVAAGLVIFFLYPFFSGNGTLETWISTQIAVLWNGTLPAETALPFPAVLLLVLPVTLLFWLLMRKIPSLWAVTLLSAGLISFSALTDAEHWLAPFLLLFAGNLLFLPRVSVKGEGRSQAQLVAALLLLPILGLGLLLGPKETGQWRSQGLVYFVQDVGDFWEFHFGTLPELSITSMRSMGLQPQSDRLGGDIELSDETVITGGTNTLLRGQVLDNYTGHGWEDRDPQGNGNFRYESFFWSARKTEAFCTDLPPDVNRPLFKSLLKEVRTELTMRVLTRSLFLPTRVETVEPIGLDGDLYFTTQGEVYWNAMPTTSYRVAVNGETWNLYDPQFDQNIQYLEDFFRREPVFEDGDFETLKEQNIHLPDSLPASVRQLAQELTADALTPYHAATLLRDYLNEHCKYTLTPGDPAPEADFVAEFLEKKQGYCTYFASALTVLCRAAGVPARYVTGYAMIPDGERFKATRATAHAWTEVYLENIGWVPIDALRWLYMEEQEEKAPTQGFTQSSPTPTPSPTPSAGTVHAESEPEKLFDLQILWWAVLALGAVGLFFLWRLLQRRRYTEKYVKRHFPGRTDAAGHYYAGLLRLFKILGHEPQPGETLSAFEERLCGALPEDPAKHLPESFEIISRLLYGGFPPNEAEMKQLNTCYQAVREYIHKTMGFKGRLLVP